MRSRIRRSMFSFGLSIFVFGVAWVQAESGLPQAQEEAGKISGGESGGSAFGARDYIEYIRGNLPIVISVPHGGHLQAPEIPEREFRTGGHYDLHTQELAREIILVFRRKTGKVPYVIINRLHRDKLDANREVADGAGDDSLATAAWEDFHGFIEQASNEVMTSFGGGLYIDLHGHRHRTQATELGYLLVAGALNVSDEELNEQVKPAETSIGTMLKGGKTTLAAIVRGRKSLGDLLEMRGFPAVPSPDNPRPDRKEYFSGGYNLERHSTFSAGVLPGIQVEVPLEVREGEERTKAYAEAFGSAVIEFLKDHGIFSY